jgi:hypothetical protein
MLNLATRPTNLHRGDIVEFVKEGKVQIVKITEVSGAVFRVRSLESGGVFWVEAVEVRRPRKIVRQAS